jgi:hypothetical protein
VLDAFVAGGGNFVDTADGYSAFLPGNSGGESETIGRESRAGRGFRPGRAVHSRPAQATAKRVSTASGRTSGSARRNAR